ncbi:MAG: DNA-3-methyladenine glycosylase I [Kiritimatiellae bacterium]|nr:DNA-3-methyladenine glycosylase I [Kiritimatiellia bacterium]MDD4026229.1 DNA-3-methyladenine glycosylase I [Kiritimatiellia bacterium]MDD4622246.1 DNA-3-methyladenine glycosylase I [Kiritimatiellia bacterium]
MKKRCAWCGADALYVAYHDEEWGVPVHDDRLLFEFLVLEGAQAGLSWLTVLRKRQNYRKAFDAFDCARVSRYTGKDVTRLLADSGIIRNRLKIESAIKNAQGVLEIQAEYGSLDAYFWRYVDGAPKHNAWASIADLPAKSALSEMMSRDLKQRGFSFVGPTVCYSFMQAVGIVNDHTIGCFRHNEIRNLSRPARCVNASSNLAR